MAHLWAQKRAPNYERFAARETPAWFKDAKLGIFIHWGPYSVPAWAETVGELGRMPEEETHKHNPYAEWYFNTIRFPDSPAHGHHKKTYNDAPYDDFIDQWKAKDFDADKLVSLFKRVGARYVVPVTKHHDGVTLWDAPETKGRNTVQRGPKRDLVKEWADACKKQDLRFGVYYSTGIDWHVWPTEVPWQKGHYDRPGINDHAYNEYAFKHCQDLIERYKPSVLWGDIDWPKAGVAPGEYSLEKIFDNLYEKNSQAVINDRFGDTHWDFTTVEYGLGQQPDDDQMWQSTRGIGLSFGYNQNEDSSHSMSGIDAIKLVIDVASKGGNVLLNVGPDANGNIPPIQMKCLEEMAEWMGKFGGAVNDTRPVNGDIANPVDQDDIWIRWLGRGKILFGFILATGKIRLDVNQDVVDVTTLRSHDGQYLELGRDGTVDMETLGPYRPAVIQIDMR